MPDHLHLFVSAQTEESNALRFMASAKQLSGFWYKTRCGRQLWQRSTWDRVVRSGEAAQTLMHYILLNPVRAGFVAAAMDYQFSGSEVYSREELIEFCAEPVGTAGLKPGRSIKTP